MLDFGWQELAVSGIVALIVLGPKELPGLMRTAGKFVRRARLIAHEFSLSLDELGEEAELDERRRAAIKQVGLDDSTLQKPPEKVIEKDAEKHE